MRISTAQFYSQSVQQITSKDSEINDQVKYLSSGKRVLSAKDDALAYSSLSGFKEDLSNIKQYQRNITQAEQRNKLQETAFDSAQGIMQQLKQTFIQANNGAMSNQDIQAIAAQLSSYQGQILDIANRKDETNGYIFAGHQVDNKPFALQPDNSVNYLGDNGVRSVQIGKNLTVATNQAGDASFEKIGNPIGDFSASYTANSSGFSLASAKIVNRSNYNTAPLNNPPFPAVPQDYTFNFGAPNLNITDSGGTNVFSAPYTPGQTIAFQGIEVTMEGNPAVGDNFKLTPEQDVSVFATLKSAIDWAAAGISPANPAQHKVDYDKTMGQINAALNHMSTRQVDAGVRLQLIERQESNHLDSELYLESGRSNIEDLDYAKAIAEFEQSKVVLQAAQQTFVQVKELSLFNFI